MAWEYGRQNKSYQKWKIAAGKKWDCYLIKYEIGCKIPPHVDRVDNFKHYRLNILLRGEDNFNGKTIFKWWRFVIFRPDIETHSVEKLNKNRLVLSFGWIRE